MIKYSFWVYHLDYPLFLDKIRELGMLHVIEKTEGSVSVEEIQKKTECLKKLNEKVAQFDKFVLKKRDEHLTFFDVQYFDEYSVLAVVEEEINHGVQLEERFKKLQTEIEELKVWGSFDYDRVLKIQEFGWKIQFFSCTLQQFNKNWVEQYDLFEIHRERNLIYFIVVSPKDKFVDIEADSVTLESMNLSQGLADLDCLQEELVLSRQKLDDLIVANISALKVKECFNRSELELEKVWMNTLKIVDDKVMSLEAWCPEPKVHELNEFLDSYSVYYEFSPPMPQEVVPVLLKNNRFMKLFEWIGDLYDIPNYYEVDLTPFFAPFFMLFFGLCLGDAGYGLVFIVLSLMLSGRVAERFRPIFRLILWLGIATVFLGVLSGGFFGYNLLNSPISWLTEIKMYMLDSKQLFYFSLLVGVVQIVFGMFIKAIGIMRRYGWMASISTWGWLFLILSSAIAYQISQQSLFTESFYTWYFTMVGVIGFITIFVLNNVKRNPLVNLGLGLWDSYNMLTGLLGDVLSYIRLFAIGISGAVMGFVFNDLAFNLSPSIPVLHEIVTVLILVVGHGINLFMSSLSAFVHPLRLTFVEFYKNAGFEGGGKKYQPFMRSKDLL